MSNIEENILTFFLCLIDGAATTSVFLIQQEEIKKSI